jgi:hypothetical protein
MIGQGLDNIISQKKTRNLWGSRVGLLSFFNSYVDAGYLGMYDHAGKPKLLIEPGNYWNFRYFTQNFVGAFDISENLSKLGLTTAICGQVFE